VTVRFSAAFVVVVGFAVVAGMSASPASSVDERTVPCSDIIDYTKFPYLGSSRPENRYRQVLGAVAVPPAFMQQVVPTRQKAWTYWHKQGLVIRATGEAVTVTVPKIWRKRAAITWGNSGGPVSSLRFEGCGGSANVGHSYAGGFLLRSPSACIPLIFSVGKRSATVRFGVGKRCHP
jgi:hypothetical protein